MSKRIIFDHYLGHRVGGAQASLHALLHKATQPYEGVVLDKQTYPELVDESIKVTHELPFRSGVTPYTTYVKNRKMIADFFSQYDKEDVLVTQGIYGAAAATDFPGKVIYFARDQYQLTKIGNYYQGYKRLAKAVYIWAQTPFIELLWQDTRQTMAKSTLVIANSQFMADQIGKTFAIDPKVVYPPVAPAPMYRHRADALVTIGAELVKGRAIVEQLALLMPEESFVIVAKQYEHMVIKNNITYLPWTKDIESVFAQAKILLVPSQWEEAFGRVAVEAQLRGIPVLASHVGGLPEIVPPAYTVRDYTSVSAWHEAVLSCIRNTNDETHFHSMHEAMKQFTADHQITQFAQYFAQATHTNW